MNEQNVMVRLLIYEVEKKAGRIMNAPKDFEYLQKQLPASRQLSMSTLKRLWNYVPSNHIPRECTLSILSQFAGYQDWEDFLNQHADQSDSDFLGDTVKVADLAIGSEIYLEWNPDRSCRLHKTVDGRMMVVEAENCKLQNGDIFSVAWLSIGQPLYATHLVRNGEPMPDYVAGRHDGLTKCMVLS